MAAEPEVTGDGYTVVAAGEGKSYPFGLDHIIVKAHAASNPARCTIVEDTLKPGFFLARHYHKKMTEIFYILEGAITFQFDDKDVLVSKGDTVTVPARVWHQVSCPDGCKMLTIFAPGGFDEFLAELVECTESQFADKLFMNELGEKYDCFQGPEDGHPRGKKRPEAAPAAAEEGSDAKAADA